MVVTQDDALMWTDGRYYLAAEKELYEGWKMMKWDKGKLYFDWLAENGKEGWKVGADTNQLGIGSFNTRRDWLKEKKIELVSSENLVD